MAQNEVGKEINGIQIRHVAELEVFCAEHHPKVAVLCVPRDGAEQVSGQSIVQKQSEKYLVQNIPAKPLVRGELDKVYALPYTRRYHPIYEAMGGVPAIREVQFSIIQNLSLIHILVWANSSRRVEPGKPSSEKSARRP